MEDYTQPLTRQQVQDLAVAATAFVLDMKERHPDQYTMAEIHNEGVCVRFGSTRSIAFLHGREASQPLWSACANLDRYCDEQGFKPRLLLPEWAQEVQYFDPEIVSHQSLVAAGWKRDENNVSQYIKEQNLLITSTTKGVFGIDRLHLSCAGWRNVSILSRGPITLMADIQKEFNIISQHCD